MEPKALQKTSSNSPLPAKKGSRRSSRKPPRWPKSPGYCLGMSSDTAKENASVVDSSVTEWKVDMANLDGSESPNCRTNEEACRSGAEDRVLSCDQVGTSGTLKKEKVFNTRYFIIKSLSHQNIQLSIKKGIWATQVMNEPILEEAFHNSDKVILIFSVNMSGFFQGYAQMMSSVGWRRDNIWSQGGGKNKPWGNSFKVKWLRLHDLPFQKTLHLKNPWNDFKPVKISRDCQELPQDIGEALCQLLDTGDGLDGHVDRDGISGDDFPSGRPSMEPLHSLQDDTRQLLFAPMLYPPFLYQHQANGSDFQLAHQGGVGAFQRENSSVSAGEFSRKKSKHTRTNGTIGSMKDGYSGFNSGGFPAPVGPFITDDNILEMTYEEYLEAHARDARRLHHPGAAPSWSLQKSSSSKEHSADSLSASSSKKRSHHQSLE